MSRNPAALWKVRWFDRVKFWDLEVQAPTEELAVTFSRRDLNVGERIPMSQLTLISVTRLGASEHE